MKRKPNQLKGKEESTRLNKYFNGDSDGIVLAKAAIDRLLANGDKNLSIEIREVIDNSVWLIPPLSENPCAKIQNPHKCRKTCGFIVFSLKKCILAQGFLCF